MKISNLIVTLALFNTTSIALAQDAGKYDILGVQIGMTREQAESKIKVEFPDLKLIETSTYRESPGIPQSLARLKFHSKSMTVFLSFAPLSGKIFSIHRKEHIGDRYKAETWTPFETLQKAFDNKYGQPTFISEYGPVYFVVYDRNGKITKREPCNNSQIPKGFTQTKDDCGVELAYKWSQGGNGLQHKGYADGLEVSLTDYSMVNAEMKIVTVKAAEIERQKGEQRTGNKAPKL